MRTLEELRDEIVETSTAAGWYEDTRTLGEECALLHSEVSEMFEAYRNWGLDDKTRERCTHEHAEDSWAGSYCHPNHLCKPEGVASEVADVLIRLLDSCNRLNVDLEQVELYAGVISFQLAGRTFGDVIAMLHIEIARTMTDEALTIFGANILACLRATCDKYGIDLMTETERKMAFNKTRAYRHGGRRI